MTWIEPLKLETWIINVFSGSQAIFLALAMFFIFGMAAYFRMSGIAMFLMFAIFLIMFSTWIPSYILIIMGMFGGLLIGYWISKIVKN